MNGSGKLFNARLEDMVRLCERDYSPVFSAFFDERQCAAAEMWCRSNAGGLRYAFWGGFSGAMRKMLAVYPDYIGDDIYSSFPLRCITFTYRTADRLTHRDFLGSFMGLQLKPETVGDIAVADGRAQALVTEAAAGLILSSVTKIGRTGVKVSGDEPFNTEIKQEFQTVSGTVASLRLDCIVALAANISREKAAALIRGEKVDVNHFTVTAVSKEVSPGDILSVRGCGRFIFTGDTGSTRSGRLHAELRKYI